MSNHLANISVAQLKRAIEIREQIDVLTEELGQITSGEEAPASLPPTAKKGKGMSAAGRARIAAAQRARWAKVKGAKVEKAVASPVEKKKKRKMSPAARAKISAAAKERWKKAKAAGRSGL
jgi:hypothetical protein